MTDFSPPERLERLTAFSCPVYGSAGLEGKAQSLGSRFEQAYEFLSATFAVTPRIGLMVLSADDWSTHAHPSVTEYGITHYDPGRATVITGGEPASFWRGLVEGIGQDAPELLQRLRQTYGPSTGPIDLSPHIDLWIVHDLGHAFHYQFPRLWLMEFFADLCLTAFVAEREPAQRLALETLPDVMSRRPTDRFRCQRLADFEREYTGMGLDNYGWYHGLFFAWAQRLHRAAGTAPLQRLWHSFAVSPAADMTDLSFAEALQQAHPDLARMLAVWPERPDTAEE